MDRMDKTILLRRAFPHPLRDLGVHAVWFGTVTVVHRCAHTHNRKVTFVQCHIFTHCICTHLERYINSIMTFLLNVIYHSERPESNFICKWSRWVLDGVKLYNMIQYQPLEGCIFNLWQQIKPGIKIKRKENGNVSLTCSKFNYCRQEPANINVHVN